MFFIMGVNFKKGKEYIFWWKLFRISIYWNYGIFIFGKFLIVRKLIFYFYEVIVL